MADIIIILSASNSKSIDALSNDASSEGDVLKKTAKRQRCEDRENVNDMVECVQAC